MANFVREPEGTTVARVETSAVEPKAYEKLRIHIIEIAPTESQREYHTRHEPHKLR